MPDISTMSLKVAPIQFNNTFTPAQYTVQPLDSTLLARSLQLQEAREKESRANIDAIDNALAATRAQLHSSEHNWFDTKANNIRKEIDAQIELGNYQSAIRLAQESARDFKRDTEIQNKLKVNELYEKERNRVQSMNIDPLTKRYWDSLNQYSYNGTADWKPKWTPVNDVDLANVARLVASMTPEDVNSITRGGSTKKQILLDKEGNVTNDITKAWGIRASTSEGGEQSSTKHIKTKEDMEVTLRKLIADTNLKASLLQKWNVTKWALEDAKSRMDDINLTDDERARATEEYNAYNKEFMNKDGIIVIKSFDDWVDKKVVGILDTMEYYNESDTKTRHTGLEYSGYDINKNINIDNLKDSEIEEHELAGVKGTPVSTIYTNIEEQHNAVTKNMYGNTHSSSAISSLYNVE